MVDHPDVQNFDAPYPIALTKVGVRGVRKPVVIQRPGQDAPHTLVATFNLLVDLPATQKGTHMSRNVEALSNVLDEEIEDHPARSLENLCARLASRLLERHDYAKVARVEAKGYYFLPQTNPGGKPTMESYDLYAGATIHRGKRPIKEVGVGVIGMSACPCAMEVSRVRFQEQGKTPREDIPFITHNQRNYVLLKLELGEDEDVEAADLVRLAEGSLSAPTFELLKRADEADLVIQAHENPKFVEDVVRDALHFTAKQYPELPARTKIFVSSEAKESIHKHDAYAECTTTLGELR